MNTGLYESSAHGADARIIGRRIETEQFFEMGSRKENMAQPEVLLEQGKTGKYPMSMTYEKYLPKKNYLKQSAKQNVESILSQTKKKTFEKNTHIRYGDAQSSKAQTSKERPKSYIPPTKIIKYPKTSNKPVYNDPSVFNRSLAVTKESSRSNLEGFKYEEVMREAGLKKYDRDYNRPRRALSISSSSLSSMDREKGYETDSLSDLHTDELESDCSCSSCRGGSISGSDSDCELKKKCTSSTDSDSDSSLKPSTRAILSKSCGSVVQKSPLYVQPISKPVRYRTMKTHSAGKKKPSSRKPHSHSHPHHGAREAHSQHAPKKIFAEVVRPVFSERKHQARKVLKPKERSLKPEGKYVKEVHTVKCDWHHYDREESPEEVHNKIDKLINKNVDKYIMKKIVEKDEKLKKIQEKTNYREKLKKLSEYFRERNRKYLKSLSPGKKEEVHKREVSKVDIPYSKFVDREGVLTGGDFDKSLRIKRKRIKEALKFIREERKRSLNSKDKFMKKDKSVDESEVERKKNKAENNLELNQERARIAHLKLKAEKDAKNHKVKDKLKKLDMLRKTADEKLKKSIKYKFISREKVYDMTESELQRFETTHLKVNDNSFNLDIPKHIYDQENLENQSDEEKKRNKALRKKGLKKLEEHMEKQENRHGAEASSDFKEGLIKKGEGSGDLKFLEFERKLIEKRDKADKGKFGHKKHIFDENELHSHHVKLQQETDLRVAPYTQKEMKIPEEKEAREFTKKLKKKENEALGGNLGKEEIVSGVLADANLIPFPRSEIKQENLIDAGFDIPPDVRIKSKLREKSRGKHESRGDSRKFKPHSGKGQKLYVESFDIKEHLRNEFSKKKEKKHKRSNKHKNEAEIIIREDDPSRHLHLVNKNLSKSQDHREKTEFKLDPAYHEIDEIRNIENDIIIGKNTIDDVAQGRKILEQDSSSEEENKRFVKKSNLYAGSEIQKNPYKHKPAGSGHQMQSSYRGKDLGSSGKFSEKRLGYVSGKREYNILKKNKSERSKTVKFKKEKPQSRSPNKANEVIDQSGRKRLETLLDRQRNEKSSIPREKGLAHMDKMSKKYEHKKSELSDSSSYEEDKLVEERFVKNSYDLDRYDPAMEFIFKMDAKHLMDMPQLFFE